MDGVPDFGGGSLSSKHRDSGTWLRELHPSLQTFWLPWPSLCPQVTAASGCSWK